MLSRRPACGEGHPPTFGAGAIIGLAGGVPGGQPAAGAALTDVQTGALVTARPAGHALADRIVTERAYNGERRSLDRTVTERDGHRTDCNGERRSPDGL